jgi:hypothetical protein
MGWSRKGGEDVPSISLFIMMPVSGTMTLLPKRRLIVVMAEMARPEWSIVAMCEVPGLPARQPDLK